MLFITKKTGLKELYSDEPRNKSIWVLSGLIMMKLQYNTPHDAATSFHIFNLNLQHWTEREKTHS